MPAPIKKSLDSRFNQLQDEAQRMEENNDCSVKAVAAVTGASYYDAHHAMRLQGRERGKGCSVGAILRAVEEMGFDVIPVGIDSFIKKYPKPHCNALKGVTTHHMDRFNKVWADGHTYLIFTAAHVAAVIDGVNVDWSRGNAKRVQSVWRIEAK